MRGSTLARATFLKLTFTYLHLEAIVRFSHIKYACAHFNVHLKSQLLDLVR